ncbi:MAG: dolichyl-phosphate beta-glucosyltransferase [Thermoanaerobaculia bacterium]
MSLTASLIIPAYNEVNRIERCLSTIVSWAAVRPGGLDWEIILVDDGSTDQTAAAARRAAAATGMPLTLLAHSSNRGKGAAIRTGVLASSGDPILVSDADLSTPLSEFDKLAAELETHPVAIGSRAIDENLVRKRQPFYRVLLGKAGNKVIQLFAVPGIRDTQCGFKLFRGGAARELLARARVDRFAWDVEVLYLARRRGYAVAEVPVLWFNSPESRVSVWRDTPRTLWDVLRISWIHRGDQKAAGSRQ